MMHGQKNQIISAKFNFSKHG